MDQPDTLILGIGNTLLSDEGCGVHLTHYLADQHPELTGVTLVDGGTLSFTLADAIASHPYLIVADAARMGLAPGSVRLFEGDELERHLSSACGSVHEVGLQDLLDISRLSGCFPRRRALIGIEPKSLDWGEEPSPEVAKALPEAARLLITMLQGWR
jgi:hydrogenase maturation protease